MFSISGSKNVRRLSEFLRAVPRGDGFDQCPVGPVYRMDGKASVSAGSPVRLSSMYVENHSPKRRSWLFAVIALLATTAQLAVSLSPLLEGREGRATVHVESGGVQKHFLHDDATCAACQARSIHGTTPRVAPPLLAAEPHRMVAVSAVDRVESADVHLPTNPRAPPSVI